MGPVSWGLAPDTGKVKNIRSMNHQYSPQPLRAIGHFANSLHHIPTALVQTAIHSSWTVASTSQIIFLHAFLLSATLFFTQMSVELFQS